MYNKFLKNLFELEFIYNKIKKKKKYKRYV